MLEETELKVEPTSQRNCTVTEVAETYALCFATIVFIFSQFCFGRVH